VIVQPPPLAHEHLGCRLAYRLGGRAGGPPVLFVQGVGVHGDGWRPQVDGLGDRFSCLTFDNRGMAASQPIGTAAVPVGQMAADALALMDAVGWPSAHLVGHSLGGLVALQLALAAKARVRSLSLLCTFADGRIPTRLTPWMLWVGARTRIGTRRQRRRAFLRLVLPPTEWAALADTDAAAAELAPLFGHDLADSPPVVMKQFAAMKACDLTPRLGELAGVSTLVVSAAHDRIAPPAAGRAIAAAVSGARYVEVADASHGLPIRHAGRVNGWLADHVEAAERAGGTTPAGEPSVAGGVGPATPARP
jgi:pimeloyl-ACP methyl ester carboxylesterase